MKKRIIYLIGTIVFLAVLTMTVQFVGNGSDENNNLAVKNLEVLAGGTFLCSHTCVDKDNDCCMACAHCDIIPDKDESDVVASSCTQDPE